MIRLSTDRGLIAVDADVYTNIAGHAATKAIGGGVTCDVGVNVSVDGNQTTVGGKTNHTGTSLSI